VKALWPPTPVSRLAGALEAYRRRVAEASIGPCRTLRDVLLVTADLPRLAIPPHLSATMSSQDPGFKAALQEARQGSDEGGVPIGAALVSAEGKILGQGHNMRIQKGSATLHVRIASASSSPMAHLTLEGRDIHPGDRWPSPRIGLSWCDHVHYLESL
jgi:hypothetical protein